MSNDAQAAYERGKALFKSEDYPAAEGAFAEAVRLAPQNADYHAWLGRCYRAQKKSDTALSEVEQALKLDPRCAMAYQVRGRLFADNEEWENAIQDYTRAIELDPQNADSYSSRGWVFDEREEWDRAIQDYTRAIELDPQNVNPYHFRGKAFHNREEWSRAIQDLTRAIELDPQDVDSYAVRGWMFFQREEWDRAILDYKRAIELDPQDADYYLLRGGAFNGKEEWDRAIQDFARAIELDSQNVDYYKVRGGAFFQREEWDRAILDFTRAIELDPQDVVLYSARSEVYEAQGNVESYLRDRTWIHALGGPERYHTDDSDWDWAFGVVFGHLTETLLPQFKSGGERLVEYTPCNLSFGHKNRSWIHDGNSSEFEYYTNGMGYVCLTDRQLWIVSLGETSKRLTRKQSVGSKLLNVFVLRQGAMQSIAEDDRTWVMPYGSILGAQTEDEIMVLTTASDSWLVSPIFEGHETRILTGIEMGKAGKLEHLWDPPNKPEPVPAAPDRAEVLKLLAQLGELKASGVLSEAEFEEQKKKLLAQL